MDHIQVTEDPSMGAKSDAYALARLFVARDSIHTADHAHVSRRASAPSRKKDIADKFKT
jgi:hypothetical protein